MLKEKAGVIAGKIWETLNGCDGKTQKQIKKATKLIDKDLFLALDGCCVKIRLKQARLKGNFL